MISINTSNFDNMPVSLIEAAALGLPIVTTNIGGVPFLFDNIETALLVPPNNVEEFTKAINELLANASLVTTMTKKARKRVEEFDWKKVKGAWLALLSE